MSAARSATRLLATTAIAFTLGLPAAQAQSNPPPADTGTQNQTPLTKKQKDEQALTPVRPIRRVGPKDWPAGKHPAPAAASTQTKQDARQHGGTNSAARTPEHSADQNKAGKQPETTGTAAHETTGTPAASTQEPSGQKSDTTAQSKPAATPTPKPSEKAASPAAPATRQSLASIRLGTDAGGRVQLGVDQKQQIEQIVKRHHVKPAEKIAAVKIGEAPPATAVLTPVPADLIEVLPQFRGNRYFATADGLFVVDRNRVIAEIPVKPIATATATTRSQTSTTERQAPRKSASHRIRRDATVGLGTADGVVVDRVDEPVTVYRERIIPAPAYRSRRVVVEPPDERTIVLERPGVTFERVPAGRRIYLDEDD
jgi:hypothetical protein